MTKHVDPVCHMTVSEDSPHTFRHQNTDYFFCSAHCRARFEKEPTAFLAAKVSAVKTYFPLILIGAYLIGGTLLYEAMAGSWNFERMMSNFMGGFFIVFSFFKLLDLKGFSDGFRSYDLVTRAIPAYGYLYPFIELALGIAYFAHFWPVVTNVATIVVMGVGMLGIAKSLMRGSQIQCACLGTVINLPLSTVAIFENGLMIVMAAASLLSSCYNSI